MLKIAVMCWKKFLLKDVSIMMASLMVWAWERYRRAGPGSVALTSYFPGPDLGLWVGPPQYLPHLWTDRAREGAMTGFQREVLVRVQYWRCSRSQRPQNRPMTNCNEHLQVKLFGQKGILTLCDTQQFLSLILIFYFLLEWWTRKGLEMSGFRVHDVKFTKN